MKRILENIKFSITLKYQFYIIYILLFLVFNSCTSQIEVIEIKNIPEIIVDSHLLKIPFEYLKPEGITEIYSDDTTVEIISLKIDGKKIRRSWCMCGLPEAELINFKEDSYNVIHYQFMSIFEVYGFCDIHSGKKNSLNPREYRFPLGGKDFEIIYNIFLNNDITVGPYKLVFTMNWDEYLKTTN